MRKLRLQLDELAVESFEVAKKPDEVGTVRGEEATFTCQPETCLYPTCIDPDCYTQRPTEPYYPSCINTCNTCQGLDTCQWTCRDTGCQQTLCYECPE